MNLPIPSFTGLFANAFIVLESTDENDGQFVNCIAYMDIEHMIK